MPESIARLFERRLAEMAVGMAEDGLAGAVEFNAWLERVGEVEAARVFGQFDEPAPERLNEGYFEARLEAYRERLREFGPTEVPTVSKRGWGPYYLEPGPLAGDDGVCDGR